MRWLLAVSFVLFFSVVHSQVCSFSGVGGDGKTYKYDISKMTRASGNYYVSEDVEYEYDLNPCGVVKTLPTCQEKSAMLCQFTKQNKVFVASVAAYLPDIQAQNWTFLSEASPNKGVTLRTTNGDTCYNAGTWILRTAIFNFECSTSSPNTFSISEAKGCIFTSNIASRYACPGGGGSSSSSDDGLSGGSVFLILFFVGFFLYVVLGCLYKRTKQGTSGMESCPNIEFWRDLPGLMKDGFGFVKGGCKKGGESSYDEL